jgi:hypothetical protein
MYHSYILIPVHTIVSKAAAGGNQAPTVSSVVEAATTSTACFVSSVIIGFPYVLITSLRYLLAIDVVVINLKTVMQAATIQPAIACPVTDNGSIPM